MILLWEKLTFVSLASVDSMLQHRIVAGCRYPNLLLCHRHASVMMVARSERFGVQPKTSLAFFGSATSTGGSPARRDASQTTMSSPVIRRAISTTWRTEAP